MWLILNKEFYDAELRDCRAVSAYEDLDNAKEGLKRLVDNLPEYKKHLLNKLEWQNDMSFVIGSTRRNRGSHPVCQLLAPGGSADCGPWWWFH